MPKTPEIRAVLVTKLMAWINSSRMNKHVPADCFLIMYMEDNLYFNLSHLSESYKSRHVLPALAAYSDQLWRNVVPVVETWCLENRIPHIEFHLQFLCDDQRYQMNRRIEVKKDDSAYRGYLENKSI